MDKYALGFSLSNFGPKSFQKVLKSFENLEKAWNGNKEDYEKIGIIGKTFEKFDEFRKSFDVEKYLEKLEKEKVELVSFLDKKYPPSLKKLDNSPIGLFVKGNVSLLSEKFRIGVVGTRKVTNYGRDVTEILVSNLVKSGAVIVSGLALGVDGIAHKVSLDNKGLTIAVLGCGVDCCFPSENKDLYNKILENNGLIVSEYPLSMQPNKGTFPARNRIIAALSEGVLVTEAALGSGSLITADYGLKLSKKVFAVPGMINSQMSKGTLELLKKGAKLVTSEKDILEEFRIQNFESGIKKSKLERLNLTKEEKKIVSLLQNEEMTIDELSKKIKLPVSKLFISISNLELKGIIKNSGGKISIVN